MTDIVERLNELRGSPFNDLAQDAVDEIGHLRATIEQLRSIAGAVSLDAVTFGQIKKDARG